MSTVDHRLNIVVTQVGLDAATAQFDAFGKTAGSVVTQQDALQGALGKTSGAALKTGKEFSKTEQEIANTGKTSTSTSKQTMSLGDAFKSSALQITAFASGLVSTIGQFISYQKATTSLERQQALLHQRWIALEQAENKLKASIAAGSINAADAALQSEKLGARRQALEKQTEMLDQKEQQHTLSLVNLASSVIPTVINGIASLNNIYGSIKGTLESATQATADTSTATENLGTVADTTQTVSIIPLLKNFANWVIGAQNVSKETTNLGGALQNNTKYLDETHESSNLIVKAFKAMGSAVVDFATRIKTDMASSTGIIDKIKTGFSTFFSVLGSGLKAGIKAVLDFGKAMITAIVTNPVLLVITAISAAVLALITNFGGFRDMINSVGVAIGNAIPALKGFLDWFGQGANAALDAAAGLMNFDTQAKKTGQTAAQAATAMDPLLVALDRYLILGNKFEKVSEIEKHFVNARTEIVKLADQVDSSGKLMEGAITAFANVFTTAMADIPNKTEPVKAEIQAVYNVIKILEKGGMDASEAQKYLEIALNAVGTAAGTEVTQLENTVVAQQKANEAAAAGGKVMTDAEKIITDYTNSQKLAEAEFNDFAIAYVEGNYDMIKAMGLSDDAIVALLERFNKDFPEGARVVDVNGKKIIVSIKDIQDQAASMTKDIESMVDAVVKGVGDHIPPTFQQAESAIAKMRTETAYMAEVHEAAAAGIINDDKQLAEVVNELATKYWPFLGKSATDVLADIQKETANQTKEQDKANKKTDEAIQKSKDLAQTRQDEIQADQALTTEAEKLIASMGKQITVTDMTGKGLQSLIQIYDDTANATSVAADAIGLWYAELERNQAVDAATVEKLDALAVSIGTTIPDEIKSQGIPAMKEYIQQFLGIGDAAKKMKEEALQAFDELKAKAKSSLEGIVSDALGEDGDDIKKALKGLEKVGQGLESLAAKQVVIDIFLNDEKLDNDILSISETLETMYGNLQEISKEQGIEVGNAFVTSTRAELGAKGAGIADEIDMIWAQVQASTKPGETGNDMIARLSIALENSGPVIAAIKRGVNDPVLAQFGLLPPAAAQTGTDTTTAIATGIKNSSGTPAEEMRNMGILMVGQLNLILDDEVNTTLPGYINMFSQKFTEMGNTAENIAIAAQTHFKTVDDALLLMQTNLTSFYNVWDKVMKDAGVSLQTLADDSKVRFGEVDQSMQLTETNVSSLYKVWDEAMNQMEDKVETFASACETAFGKVQTAAEDATKSVQALQKSIDALKDKTVTITYKIETVGSPPKGARFGGSTVAGYAQHGGAWIQNKPKNIGGMNVSEFSKPELITATPLSNPYNVMDKSISLPSLSTSSSSGGGGPIVVTGDLHVVVQTQSGETLAKEVKPYLLKGFSGIT